MTTLHTGLPVGLHGLYEWNVYEPALQRVITPLRFSFAGDAEPDTLVASGFEARQLLAEAPTFYERLGASGVASFVFEPFGPTTYSLLVTRGAELRRYGKLGDGVRAAAEALGLVDRGYALVYFPGIDAAGHVHGPSSPEFAAASTAALDAIDRALARASGLSVLLTADHGQVDVDPARTIWLDELHPPLADLPLRPAGSARDVFLHVPEDDVEATLQALGPHVEVHRVEEMVDAGVFGTRWASSSAAASRASASCRRRAGWPGCGAPPTARSSSGATTAGEPPTSRRRGSACSTCGSYRRCRAKNPSTCRE